MVSQVKRCLKEILVMIGEAPREAEAILVRSEVLALILEATSQAGLEYRWLAVGINQKVLLLTLQNL